jgi:hypothetical protein
MHMTTYSWTLGTSGDWNTGTLWTPQTVPNDITSDVTIDAADTLYIVTIASGESETVDSLSMNAVTGLLGTNDPNAPYHAAQLELDGTLAFAPGSAGSLSGSLQTMIFTDGGDNAEIINGGTLNAFIQSSGSLLMTGTNGIYITNAVQALGGTITIDTSSIAEMTGNTLFDGIFDAKGPGAVVNLGGPLEHLVVTIGTVEGPMEGPNTTAGWTELTYEDPTAAINEWNGTAYVPVESTLTEIAGGGTVDVLDGRNYTTANTLTIDTGGAVTGRGMFNLQAGVVTTGGIDINGGVVQGYGTIASGVANNGTLIALGGSVSGTLDVTGALTGTGEVLFDHNDQSGAADPTKATLVLGSVSAGQTVTMNGGDTLVLATPAAFAGTIAAGIGDSIVLDGVTATGATLTNGTLVVSNGAVPVASLALSGSYTGDSFTTNGSIVTLGTAVAPTISGTAAGQAIIDQQTIAPFSHVVIADATVGQTETVTVTQSAAANGALSNLGGGTYNATTGVYTDTGSAAAVTADLNALVFTPALNGAAPGQTIATGFTISDVDSAGLTATDAVTSVVTTAVAPTISGTAAGQAITDQQTIAPFSHVAITDAAAGQTETVTVTQSAAANGTLSNLGGGAYNAITGVYTDTGSAAAVTADLNALVFTPTLNEVASGQTVATGFTISDVDSAGVTATDAVTSVVATGTSETTPGAGSGDALNLAAQITAQLTSMGTAGTLRVTNNAGSGAIPAPPAVGAGTVAELVLSGPGGLMATVPAGYSYVLAQASTADTITGSNIMLAGGPAGGLYDVSGTSSVAATGGSNIIFATGNFMVSTAEGTNTVSASGTGTVATDTGANLIFASGNTNVLSVGQDTVVAGSGSTALQSSGANSLIFGDFGGSDGVMNLALSGGTSTVSSGNSNVTATLTGSSGLVFGAAANGGALNVLDQGTNDTISGLTSAATVTGGTGSSGLLAFGGNAGLDFVGGAAAATVMTAAATNTVAVGSGGLLVASGGDDTVTGSAGSGAATLFGSSGNVLTYTSPGTVLYAAGAGNETLNASGSTGNGTYFASPTSGSNDVIFGGSGTNIFVAGAGSNIFIAGSGTNVFDFLASNTAGNADFISNLTAADTVNLIGYNPAQTKVSTSGGSTTLTLSDKTQISFIDVASLPASIHYS